MHRYTFESPSGTGKYVRIDRRKAKRLFDAGHCVTAVPHKMRPFGPWHMELVFDGYADMDTGFDLMEAYAVAYNCCHEAGYYLAYYVHESLAS